MTESGGTSKWEMTYNMDSELEKMQTLTTFNGVEYIYVICRLGGPCGEKL